MSLLCLVLYVCFVDRCLSFCTFSFAHCVVCSSLIYRFVLPLWYLQTLHSINIDILSLRIPEFEKRHYIFAQKISTLFWCTGWAWNWQIIFRFASIHGRACFILHEICMEPVRNVKFSKVNFHAEKKPPFLSVCQKRFNKILK
jgi:hypothetical protein